MTDTISLTHAAICSRCGQTGDDDGGEYQKTPELAVEVALSDLGFYRIGGRLVCENCPTDAEYEALIDPPHRSPSVLDLQEQQT